MNSCIRCGADVVLDQAQYMYMTLDGGFSCPASLPGEAGVHRIANDLSTLPKRPKPQRPKATVGGTLMKLASLVAIYKGAEYVTRGHHHEGPSIQDQMLGFPLTGSQHQDDYYRRDDWHL
jgi:hypothetical protein